MNPVVPPPATRGSRIRLVAPAGPIDPAAFEEGKRALTAHYEVVAGDVLLSRDGYHAGNDALRLADLQAALDDPLARAVVAARGGYGTTRILDRLDLRALAANPKWIVGCSDVTALLVRVWTEIGLQSIHGPMAASLGRAHTDDARALFDLLEGHRPAAVRNLEPLCEGEVVGPMVGGNVTVLAHLVGSLPGSFARDAIVFLEDVNEAPYRLDRCLVQLLRAGALDGVAGFVLGGFEGCPPGPDGVTAMQAVMRNLEPLGVPVAGAYPAAHGERNLPWLHGARVSLFAGAEAASLTTL
ncbi:MAG: LD-carboxypeptidase [Deltaproteobacteria bacterium]|nr:LD-carboxypeptidase [Deltaproteobacteria bacterium]